MKLLLLIHFISIFSCALGEWKTAAQYTVLQKGSSFTLTNGIDSSGVAWGSYDDAIETTGWSNLIVTTNAKYDDNNQMYAAGYLEGAVTVERIWQSYYNGVYYLFNGTIPSTLSSWLLDNYQWMLAQVAANTNDPYWVQVGLVVTQMQGMLKGYNDYCKQGQELDTVAMLLASAGGDVEDIIIALEIPSPILSRRVDNTLPFYLRSHCSVLIKPTPTGLFATHATWTDYSSMLRIYKIYNFNLQNAATSSKQVSFSSYPGSISSIDDFYITDTKLCVMETTNTNLDPVLYELISKESLLTWVRTVVANRMATNGSSWSSLFSRDNSGTYNNQWMIVDYNKYTTGLKLPPDTLWITEQLPGIMQSGDVSDVVNQQGYWPSYNVPYFQEIYDWGGYAVLAELFNFFSYDKNPRAEIFRRDQSKVSTLQDVKNIITYNNWQHDPLAHSDAASAISSRFDLINQTDWYAPFLEKGAFGAIDAKITSSQMIANFTAIGISGPTKTQQPVFVWTDEWQDPHEGHPQQFNFDWQTFQNVKLP